MACLQIFVLTVLVAIDAVVLERKPQSLRKFEAMCRNVTVDPYFEDSKVVGTVWRIYYAWNMVMGDRCMDIRFRKASNSTKARFWDSMQQHMETKPNWAKATLMLTINGSREMLLIPDQTHPKAGWFSAVPNIHKGEYLGGKKWQVPLFKMAMKLFHQGRYLLMGDCQTGVTSFLVRRDQKHTWGEISSVVTKLHSKFGGEAGFPACKFNMRKRNRRLKSKV